MGRGRRVAGLMGTVSLNPPLAGRQAELGELRMALDDALGGHGRLVLLRGEPGIGKTRLAEELCQEAETRGAMVAWGAAWDGGGAPPYFPWTEVLRALGPILPEPSPALARDLGPLWEMSATQTSVASTQEASEALHFRRADALRAALALAAAERPLVIVLDDLHAADLATLRALYFVARCLRALPILIVGTARDLDGALCAETSTELAKIARQGTVLSVARLDEQGVRELLAAHDPLPQKWLGQVASASLGNPFFVHEFLRLLRTGAALDRVPDGIRLLVLERTSRLPDDARAILDAAAVVGRQVPLGVLAAMLELERSKVTEILASPRQAGIVELAADGSVHFSHPLFRECLYDELSPGRRTELHAQAAEALAAGALLPRTARSDWSEEAIVRHELLALPRGELARVIERGRHAAEVCRRAFAFDRAVDLLELCVRGLGDCGEPCHQTLGLDVDLELAEALVFVGAGERGRALCLAVAEQARAGGDVARFARAALTYGAEIRPGVTDPIQVQLLEEARRLLPSAELDLSARVLARLAATRSDPEPDEPLGLAYDAIRLARQTGNDDTLLQALHMGGAALVCYASPAIRRDAARELAQLATEKQELVLAQRGYQRLAIDASELLDFEELDSALSADLRLGDMLGHARFRWRSALLASLRAQMTGRWAASDAAVARARELVSGLDDPVAQRSVAIHRMGSVLVRGRGTASDFEATWPAELRQDLAGQIMGALSLASMLGRWGDIAGAKEHFARVWPLPPPALTFLAAVQLALDAAARIGNVEACQVLLPRMRAAPGPGFSWGAQGYLWLGLLDGTTAAAELVLGHIEESINLFARAATTARRLGLSPAAVENELGWAQALLARGGPADRALARDLLDRARALAGELDMRIFVRLIDAAGTALSQLSPPAVETPPLAASDRNLGPLSLDRQGEFWRLEGFGQTVLLKHSRAVDILKVLVDHPCRDFHVLDFGAEAGDGLGVDRGDGGELIDEGAKRAYQSRLTALTSELAEAESWHDQGRSERLQAEREFLEDELRRSLAPGGRIRRTTHAAERARVNVTKRLKGVIDRLDGEQPTLADHLKTSIKTGTYVSYQPIPGGVTLP